MNCPYETLGIETDATLLEAERALQRLRELYAEGSMAIYSLLTEEQRQARLDAIEAAFRGIVEGKRAAETEATPVPVLPAPQRVSPDLEGAPDPHLAPGAFLRWLRLRSGHDLKELAERTKLQPSRLEHIEAERYAQLPPPVYLRGFVAEYARCLGFAEPRQLAESYLRRMPRTGGDDHC